MKIILQTLFFLLLPTTSLWASEHAAGQLLHHTSSVAGYVALVTFIIAYTLVIFEEKIHLRKSKPVMLAAGIIWILLAVIYAGMGDNHAAHNALIGNIAEYAELMLFLLAAMTYINSMDERNVFQALRSWLISRGFSLRVVFWVTGLLSFVISPLADNLTTALLMGAVAMAVGGDNKKFVVLACINIVVAANAGGAFSPFGDITTLMIWQKGKVEFYQFLYILIPALVNWLVPAFIMSLAVAKGQPHAMDEEIHMKLGAKRVIFLFGLTIITAVSFHNFLNLPPAAGMMTGLAYLGFFSHWLKRKEKRLEDRDPILGSDIGTYNGKEINTYPNYFDFMKNLSRAEWDTLLFFYGVILCVGGLSQFGYLALASGFMYHDLGATTANVMVGFLSAIVDNIPVTYAVLTMDPAMELGQWLLVTLTAGVGGSLLSIGSAAGVALMGTARGIYTFGAHLKWMPIIALGYAGSIYIHLIINKGLFN